MKRLGQGMAAVPAPVWPHLVGHFAAPGRAAVFAILAWGSWTLPMLGAWPQQGGTGVMGRGKLTEVLLEVISTTACPWALLCFQGFIQTLPDKRKKSVLPSGRCSGLSGLLHAVPPCAGGTFCVGRAASTMSLSPLWGLMPLHGSGR